MGSRRYPPFTRRPLGRLNAASLSVGSFTLFGYTPSPCKPQASHNSYLLLLLQADGVMLSACSAAAIAAAAFLLAYCLGCWAWPRCLRLVGALPGHLLRRFTALFINSYVVKRCTHSFPLAGSSLLPPTSGALPSIHARGDGDGGDRDVDGGASVTLAADGLFYCICCQPLWLLLEMVTAARFS